LKNIPEEVGGLFVAAEIVVVNRRSLAEFEAGRVFLKCPCGSW
jgi:hypothetical protein